MDKEVCSYLGMYVLRKIQSKGMREGKVQEVTRSDLCQLVCRKGGIINL